METTTLLVFDQQSAISTALPHRAITLSPLMLAALREAVQHLGDRSHKVELRISTAHLNRAREASAALGNAEVFATADGLLVADNDNLIPLELDLECRATGPIRLTTQDEWWAQP